MAETLRLPKDRELFFIKQVDQASIGELTKSIIEINKDDELLKKLYSVYGMEYTPKPIKIFIDSYGGYVYQCFGLLSVIERSETPIHTIVTGCAMSCGFMMLISGHKRFAHRLSTPLYHQVSSGVGGTVKEIEEHLEESKRLQKTLEDIVKEKTKITKKRLREIYDYKKDWFMSADEALELGVVDEILS
jgi:ATP-dependent Clp protease protease subunit